MYCDALVRTVESNKSGISHGVCQKCLPRLAKEMSQPLSKFLDDLDAPILILGENMQVISANEAARKISKYVENDLNELRCGEVIGCSHSREENGCGNTVHCLSCAIRKSVAHTFKTGEPCLDVPAYPDVCIIGGGQPIRFRITTEKKGDFVCLLIHQL